MPELDAPTVRLHAEWLDAHEEWGPGAHEDGFGLRPSDDVGSAAGFAVWVERLLNQSDPVKATAMGRVPCTFRWVVEDSRALGGIALRHGLDDKVLRIGHIGYGIRPSARGRGLATWALGPGTDAERGPRPRLGPCAACVRGGQPRVGEDDRTARRCPRGCPRGRARRFSPLLDHAVTTARIHA